MKTRKGGLSAPEWPKSLPLPSERRREDIALAGLVPDDELQKLETALSGRTAELIDKYEIEFGGCLLCRRPF